MHISSTVFNLDHLFLQYKAMFQCLKVLALPLRVRRGGGLEACGRGGKWI